MKFEIFKGENNDKFYFHLKAGNGQVVLASQGYASKASAMNGIESVKANAGDEANYERKEASNGKPFFNLLAKNKQVIGKSQMYASKSGVDNGIRSIKEGAADAEVVDLTIQDA